MRKTTLRIVRCAAALFLLCVFCRFVFFHTMDVYLPTCLAKEGSFEESGLRLTVQDPEILRVEKTEMHDNYLKVTVVPGRAGETEMDLAGPDGEEQSCYVFRVDALKTVYDMQSGGFTGDGAVLAALVVFTSSMVPIMRAATMTALFPTISFIISLKLDLVGVGRESL